MDWQMFKGKLMIEGKTVKEWSIENKLDVDRVRNIMGNKTTPTVEEVVLFAKVIEG